MSFSKPIAFLIFNRPAETMRVFAEIAKVRPRTLLVVCDGPRLDRPDESRHVKETQAIIDQVDWPCDVRTNYSQFNLGCKRRIASGLEWVFGQCDEAIILEDDCLPDPTFFPFCEELLKRYRHDERIVSIGGSNYQHGQSRTPHSYYFSKYFHCWGWASWRRVWENYDLEMSTWPDFRDSGGVEELADSARETAYWREMFEKAYRGEFDTWDFAWFYSCWAQRGLSVIPDENLISNIGFGQSATHTSKIDTRVANLPLGQINTVDHPATVVRCREADIYTFPNNFQRESRIRKLRQRLKNHAFFGRKAG